MAKAFGREKMLSHVIFWAADAGITFGFLLILVRWIGETQISQVTYFNWVAGACMGNVGANMLTSQSILDVIKYATILFFFSFATVIAAWLSLKSKKFRDVASGVPVVLLKDGEMIDSHLKQCKINHDLLIQLLREQGYFNYRDIKWAILEPTGTLSVLPKEEGHITSEKGQNPSSQERRTNQHIK